MAAFLNMRRKAAGTCSINDRYPRTVTFPSEISIINTRIEGYKDDLPSTDIQDIFDRKQNVAFYHNITPQLGIWRTLQDPIGGILESIMKKVKHQYDTTPLSGTQSSPDEVKNYWIKDPFGTPFAEGAMI